MKVKLGCPNCDDGVLIVDVSPDAVDDIEDLGCGHAEALNTGRLPSELAEAIWAAAGDKEEALYDQHIDNMIDRRLGK